MALILLIHYAGDVAQPLHVGEGYLDSENKWVNHKESQAAQGTLGGNRLIWGTANLHFYWDKSVVLGAMRADGFNDHPKEYARFLASQIYDIQPPPGGVETWPATFAGRMSPKVRPAYEGLMIISFDGKKWTIDQPSDQYNKMAAAMTGDNLRIGGEQLAAILKGIWP